MCEVGSHGEGGEETRFINILRVSPTGDFTSEDIEQIRIPTPWLAGSSVELELRDTTLEAVAALTGIPLVDLSIEYDTHIIRGED